MRTEDDAKKALAKLFLVFPSPGTGETNEGRMRAYWEILSRKAPCFVIEACEYAARGKCGDGRFLPSAGELFQLCEEFSARAVRLRNQSNARIPPPLIQNDEMTRCRIREGFRKLLIDLKNEVPIDPDNATRDVFGYVSNLTSQSENAKPIGRPPKWHDPLIDRERDDLRARLAQKDVELKQTSAELASRRALDPTIPSKIGPALRCKLDEMVARVNADVEAQD